MSARLRQNRNTFLLFLAAIYVSLIGALPIVSAALPSVKYARMAAAYTEPTFEQLDRNHDGYIDRDEATRLPGLDRVFESADRRAEGRLDKVEYAKALAMREERK
jgi:hypothetical protein